MANTITEQIIESPPERSYTPVLENPAKDDNLTIQQRERDKQTTMLYAQYVIAHKEKQDFAKQTKGLVRNLCFIWVSFFILASVGLSLYIIICTQRQVTDIVALLGAVIPFVLAIIGTLNIVVKHVFPENEEQYINEIVIAIGKNDLEHKMSNIRKGDSSIKTDD